MGNGQLGDCLCHQGITVLVCLSILGCQPRGKVQKKKLKKNLTSVSLAFTHTYTAVKTNSFRFFPQAYMENFEKCAKTGDMGTLGGGWGC